MVSFLAKPGQDQSKKRKKYIHFGYRFCMTRIGAFPKKFKKLKHVILASFVAKSGLHWQKKRKKNFVLGNVSSRLGLEYSQND